ncbi:MAG TPA: FkbM family methyltransferase [Phycisphaerales bacterium]|nr:FkbM family methyltransferase [Phycisphaerales bacterium]
MPTLLITLGLGLLGAAVAVLIRQQRLARRRQRETAARVRECEAGLIRLRAKVYGRLARPEIGSGPPGPPVEFTSESGEDALLWDLFEERRTGFYVEVGAFDGYTLSVTYPFEAMGWTGVLVEALPERAEACRARRPRSMVVHAALGPRGSQGRASFTVVGADETDEMLSFLSTSAVHARNLERRGDRRQTVTVPLTTMDRVLDDAGVAPGTIDFVVIDVEGGELGLLRGFDLERFRPRVLCIEDLARGRDGSVRAHVEARGYEHAGVTGRNDLYVRADEPALLARARRLTAVLR